MKRLTTSAETEEKSDCVTLLVNTEQRIKEINAVANVSLRCSLYTACLVYCDIFKGNQDLYKKIHPKYLEQKIIAQASYTKEKTKQVKTEKEEEKWTDMKNLHQARLNWEVLAKTSKGKKQVKASKNWLIASLYTVIPPRRNEYRSLVYIPITDDEEGVKFYKEREQFHKKHNTNLIYRLPTSPPTYKMILREYKTHPTYGDFEMMIDEEHPLYEPLAHYLKVSEVNVKENLMFPNGHGVVLNTASWGRILNSVFKSTGRKISSTMMRHIYISDKFKGDTPLQVRKDLAKMMGHQPTTAQLVYEKK